MVIDVGVVFNGPGRLVEEHSNVIGPAHQQTWRDAGELASPRTYKHNGMDITVEMDWSVVARQFIRQTQLRSRGSDDDDDDRWLERSDSELRIPTKVRVRERNENNSLPIDAQFFVTYHISNVFLALNIAAPGCANFHGMVVKGRMYDQTIGLSGYDYDFAWAKSIDGRWPVLKKLPLKLCFDWLRPLERRIVQIAETPLERVTLSMMHIAQQESSPTSIIWICSALESIFQVSVGQGFTQLHNRMSELLAADSRQAKHLKRRLRELYDLRNSFAHGGHAIIHPHFSESVDPGLEKKMGDYVDLHCEGVQLLVACVQELTGRQWSGVQFEERMLGAK